MNASDLVRVITNVPGSKITRRSVAAGEVGMLIRTRYIGDLSVTTQLWCEMLAYDGVITVPSWCVERVVDETG